MFEGPFEQGWLRIGAILLLLDISEDPWPVNKVICSASLKKDSNGTYLTGYSNPDIDIHVINNPYLYISGYMEPVNFNLTIMFHPCGGILRDNPSGVIEPPKDAEGNYTNNEFCLWTLQAPEGKVVSVS